MEFPHINFAPTQTTTKNHNGQSQNTSQWRHHSTHTHSLTPHTVPPQYNTELIPDHRQLLQPPHTILPTPPQDNHTHHPHTQSHIRTNEHTINPHPHTSAHTTLPQNSSHECRFTKMHTQKEGQRTENKYIKKRQQFNILNRVIHLLAYPGRLFRSI